MPAGRHGAPVVRVVGGAFERKRMSRMERVLIVDDEEGIRTALLGILGDEGFAADSAVSGEQCLEKLAHDEFDCVILDVWLPGRDGLETLEELRKSDYSGSIVMISGHGSIETAVKATKLGAFDFLEKPLSLEKTVLVVKNAIRQKKLEEENRALRERFKQKNVMIGDSEWVKKLREDIKVAAPTNGRVFIFGENGTGKELVARMIHEQSLRAAKPFIEMNCAAVPEELIESELFGHEKGSFTGAVGSKRGKFELADEGTLFLDEIGDMSLKMQSKVLRVLQEQRFQTVGGSKTISVNVRVIAATNKSIEEDIQAGRFREDLYFRLNVIPLTLPPLRERGEDMGLLAEYFMSEFTQEYGKKPKTFSKAAMAQMMSYHWPGNVRELKNYIERLVIMVPGDCIEEKDLPPPIRGKEPSRGTNLFADFDLLKEAREQFEKQFIMKKLEECGGNITKAADLLGLERSNLHRKLKAFDISVHKNGQPKNG
jgi:two-component system nitrogen regulation response regulator NtrX